MLRARLRGRNERSLACLSLLSLSLSFKSPCIAQRRATQSWTFKTPFNRTSAHSHTLHYAGLSKNVSNSAATTLLNLMNTTYNAKLTPFSLLGLRGWQVGASRNPKPLRTQHALIHTPLYLLFLSTPSSYHANFHSTQQAYGHDGLPDFLTSSCAFFSPRAPSAYALPLLEFPWPLLPTRHMFFYVSFSTSKPTLRY